MVASTVVVFMVDCEGVNLEELRKMRRSMEETSDRAVERGMNRVPWRRRKTQINIVKNLEAAKDAEEPLSHQYALEGTAAVVRGHDVLQGCKPFYKLDISVYLFLSKVEITRW
ncbi:hypothetical protein PIB30_006361 [Stylosanthes scabra]|uniref:Uncharacterized protein n=1 Tax=Stylosanthes scabra TaxID=79078 RepID=A0ABU6S5C9_9FABA|nr:hypothetical protein [Stylosanthes scabra]